MLACVPDVCLVSVPGYELTWKPKKLPGALTLVARRGEVVFLDCLGWRDLEARTPLELNSIFRFYSMSKPITSVAVMMLYEEGWFQLDDPVSKFIPELEDMKVYRQGEASRILCEPAASPITIQQLLTHTSGAHLWFFRGRRDQPAVLRGQSGFWL